MAAEGQTDTTAAGMEVRVQQWGSTEFLHAEKLAPRDVHQCLLNAAGDQTVGAAHGEVVPGVFQQWQQQSFPLVQMFMSMACKLMFVPGENTELAVVTAGKQQIPSYEALQTVLLCSL